MRFFCVLVLICQGRSVLAADFLLTNNIVSLSLQSTVTAQNVLVSGYSLGLAVQKSVSRKLTFGLAFEPLLNFASKEISRYSYGGYLQLVLLGKAHRYEVNQSEFSMVSYGNQALYGILRAMNNNYQTMLPDSKESIQGSNLELQCGLGYSRGMGAADAVGLEGSVIALSFITAAQKIQSTGYQLSAYWLFGL